MCLSPPLGAPSSQRLLGCPNTAGLGGEAAWLGSPGETGHVTDQRGVDEWFQGTKHQTEIEDASARNVLINSKDDGINNGVGLKILKRPVINQSMLELWTGRKHLGTRVPGFDSWLYCYISTVHLRGPSCCSNHWGDASGRGNRL